MHSMHSLPVNPVVFSVGLDFSDLPVAAVVVVVAAADICVFSV